MLSAITPDTRTSLSYPVVSNVEPDSVDAPPANWGVSMTPTERGRSSPAVKHGGGIVRH